MVRAGADAQFLSLARHDVGQRYAPRSAHRAPQALREPGERKSPAASPDQRIGRCRRGSTSFHRAYRAPSGRRFAIRRNEPLRGTQPALVRRLLRSFEGNMEAGPARECRPAAEWRQVHRGSSLGAIEQKENKESRSGLLAPGSRLALDIERRKRFLFQAPSSMQCLCNRQSHPRRIRYASD